MRPSVRQARKNFHCRSQPEFPGAFKMVDFQSIFCHVLVSGAAEWPFESDGCAAGLQNFFQAYRAVLHNLLFDSFEENKYYSICRCWRCTRARWQQVAGAAPCHSLTALAAAPGASSIPRCVCVCLLFVCVFAVCVCVYVCCLCVCAWVSVRMPLFLFCVYF